MNEALPFVSISISFFNAESTLLDAVRSVFAQTHKNWELILIDDGSTDNSLELARSINEPRVRVYSDGENKKLAARLNQAITLSKYDFIARMDADDLMAPDRIEKQLKILTERKDIDLVSTGVLSLSDENTPVGIRVVPEGHVLTAKNILRAQSGIIHASVLARKSWYQRNNYREDYPAAEDSELWVRAYSKSDLKVFFIREPLYFYREDGNVTKEKLLRGYGLGRRLIRDSATSNFSFYLKINTFIRSFSKTAFVILMSFFNRLDFLRERRNRGCASDSEMSEYLSCIKSILSHDLILNKSDL